MGERDSQTGSGRRPSDTEELVGGTAASDRLTDRQHAVQPGEAAAREGQRAEGGGAAGGANAPDAAVRGSGKTGGLPATRRSAEGS